MMIIVETAGESTEQTDVLELVRDSWRQIGIKLFTKPSQREVFRNRIFAGETLMSIDKGVENGLVTAAYLAVLSAREVRAATFNLAVNDEILLHGSEQAPVKNGDRVELVVAMSGG